MFINYTVIPGQNLLDIAIQKYGSPEGIYNLCLDNNLNIDDVILPGDNLIIDPDKVINKKLVEYYSSKNITIASN